MHQPRVARDDDDEPVAVVLHPLQQRLDRLRTEVLALVADGERIRLVDEEDAVERASDHAVGLDRRHPDVLADEPGAIDLDQMAAPQQPHRAVHLGEQPRHRRLARAWVPEEDEVLRGRHLGQPVPLPLGLHLQERDERVHLLLHRLEPDQRGELRLHLVERPHRLGAAELLDGIGAALRQALAEHAQAAGDVFEWIRHRRDGRSWGNLPVPPDPLP